MAVLESEGDLVWVALSKAVREGDTVTESEAVRLKVVEAVTVAERVAVRVSVVVGVSDSVNVSMGGATPAAKEMTL